MNTFRLFGATGATPLESLLAYSYSLWQGRSAAPYDEPVFHHFLSLERNRAEHSPGGALIVLVSLTSTGALGSATGETSRMSPLVATRLFSSLARSVREVDFIGWHREGRVAGAVLVQGPRGASSDSSGVKQRVTAALRESLPPELHQALQVRVLRLRTRARRGARH